MIGLSAMLMTGCALAPTTNLLDPTSPSFEGSYAPTAVADTAADAPASVRVVTFNIKLGRRIDRAITVLQGDSLRGADILALVEMDERGVDQIALALTPSMTGISARPS
jgi:hypothetical protein